MHQRHLLISALVVSAAWSAACDRSQPERQPQQESSATASSPGKKSAAEAEAPATTAEAAKTGATREAPVWPDGYFVASEEDWVPVINQAGEKLEAARNDYIGGSPDKAAKDLRGAASAIREDVKVASADDKDKLEQRAKELDATADKLAKGDRMDQVTFDEMLLSVYRQDVPVTWLYSQEEVVRPYFERPSEHSTRALQLLAQHDNAGAAAEIRRSTAYFRLAQLSARDDDREILQHNIDLLNAQAKEAEQGKLTPDELRKTLARVDAAYAASYLHQAEARYEAKDAQHATRSLREAMARMRSRLRLIGRESEAASVSVLNELEALADKLGKGAKVTAKDVKSLFKRAHKHVKSDVAS